MQLNSNWLTFVYFQRRLIWIRRLCLFDHREIQMRLFFELYFWHRFEECCQRRINVIACIVNECRLFMTQKHGRMITTLRVSTSNAVFFKIEIRSSSNLNLTRRLFVSTVTADSIVCYFFIRTLMGCQSWNGLFFSLSLSRWIVSNAAAASIELFRYIEKLLW